jgi:hypothetical protein
MLFQNTVIAFKGKERLNEKGERNRGYSAGKEKR